MTTLDIEVDKEFNASKFVKKILTIGPEFAGLTRHSMVKDRLVYQIDEALGYCWNCVAVTEGELSQKYADAITQLANKREELAGPYKESSTSRLGPKNPAYKAVNGY